MTTGELMEACRNAIGKPLQKKTKLFHQTMVKEKDVGGPFFNRLIDSVCDAVVEDKTTPTGFSVEPVVLLSSDSFNRLSEELGRSLLPYHDVLFGSIEIELLEMDEDILTDEKFIDLRDLH